MNPFLQRMQPHTVSGMYVRPHHSSLQWTAGFDHIWVLCTALLFMCQQAINQCGTYYHSNQRLAIKREVSELDEEMESRLNDAQTTLHVQVRV